MIRYAGCSMDKGGSPEKRSRNLLIAELHQQGLSSRAIGREVGVSHQRVQQILARDFGVGPKTSNQKFVASRFEERHI